MNDRELLELAAKANGHEYPCVESHRGQMFEWNPLKDDGDALRLAVEARLQIITSGTNIVQAIDYWSEAYGECEVGDDRVAATRRAIVLAAAEIGKQKESENA